MQTLVRYSVVKEDGKPVIRAVPVPRRPVAAEAKSQERPAEATTARPFLSRIRRLRLPEIR